MIRTESHWRSGIFTVNPALVTGHELPVLRIGAVPQPGHAANPDITARIYAHSQDEALAAAATTLGQVVTPS